MEVEVIIMKVEKQLPKLKDDPAWSKAIDWGEETNASNVDDILYKLETEIKEDIEWGLYGD